MGKSVFKLVADIKAASIAIGSEVEEAEDIKEAVELCKNRR